jgi:hypothetical protein
MNEKIYPSEETKQCMYRFYILTCESNFSIAKKRQLMTTALGSEKWCWRVVGITKQAITKIANNDFRKTKGLERDHFKKSRSETYTELFFNEKYSLEKWWQIVWDNDETILMTKEEHDKHKKLNKDEVIDVDYKLGFFRSSPVGMSFIKKLDGEYVKKLYKEMGNG